MAGGARARTAYCSGLGLMSEYAHLSGEDDAGAGLVERESSREGAPDVQALDSVIAPLLKDVYEQVTMLALRPGGSELAVAHPEGLGLVRLPQSAGASMKIDSSHRVHAVAWSDDGTLLAAAMSQNGATGEVIIFKADEAYQPLCSEPLLETEEYQEASSLAWESAGRFLAAGCDDGFVRIIDVEKQHELEACRVEGDGSSVYGVAWGASGLLASVSKKRSIRVMDVSRARVETMCVMPDAHTSEVKCVDWCHPSSGAERLATGSADRTVVLWEIRDRKLQALWRKDFSAQVECLACSRAGPLLALGLQDGSAVIVDAASDSSSECWQLHDLGSQSVRAVAWQGETILYTGSEEGAVSIRVPAREVCRRVQVGERVPPGQSDKLHSDEVRSVSWSTDGVYISSGSEDNTARIIAASPQMEMHAQARSPSKQDLPVYSTAWDPQNAAVACGLDGQLQVVNAEENTVIFSSIGLKRGKKKCNRNPHSNDIYAMAWKPDGSALITGDYNGNLGIWYKSPSGVKSLVSKEDKRELREEEYFHKSEYFRVSTCQDGDWDPQHSDSILSIAFAPDGEHFATAAWDSDIRVFNFGKKEQVLHLDHVHKEPVASLAWASKGDRTLLATGSRGDAATICILDVDISQQTSAQLRRLAIHKRAVHSISWSTDALRLATGGGDGVVNIVDTAPDDMDEWRVIWKIDCAQMDIGTTHEIRSVAWSPAECTQLAIGSSGGDVRVLDTYSHFAKLVGFLADCRQEKKNKMAGSVLEFCHRVKYAAALPGNNFTRPTKLGKLVLPTGWTVFHELVSGTKQARKTFWENPAYAFPDGCYVPTKLDRSTTVDGLQRAGLSFDKPLPFTDLTALDIAILRRDIHGTKYLLSKLRPDMELVFTTNVTRSLVLLSKYLPFHIASALEILEKHKANAQEQRDTMGIFRTTKKIDKLIRPLVRLEVRGVSYKEACKQMLAPDEVLWKSYRSATDKPNNVESACQLQLLRLGGIAGDTLSSFQELSPKDGEGLQCNPYEALVNNCPLHLQDELFESRTIKALTQFKWEEFVKWYHCGRLLFYCGHCVIAAAALLQSTLQFSNSSDSRASVVDTTVLMTSVAVTNTVVLADELLDISQDGVLNYFLSGWNLLDVGGLVALYVSVAAFATGNASMLNYSGAVGVFFNSFSILQLLRPFEGTGPVIKVTTAIVQKREIAGFFLRQHVADGGL
eukprot:COSAG02_NODE_4505_length_5285_cov_2.317971_2_plen_1206_part_00